MPPGPKAIKFQRRQRPPFETPSKYNERVWKELGYPRASSRRVLAWRVRPVVVNDRPRPLVARQQALDNIHQNWQTLPELMKIERPSVALRSARNIPPTKLKFRQRPGRYIVALLDRWVGQVDRT
jgi:hypothetical protein